MGSHILISFNLAHIQCRTVTRLVIGIVCLTVHSPGMAMVATHTHHSIMATENAEWIPAECKPEKEAVGRRRMHKQATSDY